MTAGLLELATCPICNGHGQVAPGTGCACCGGKGVCPPHEADQYLAMLREAQLEGARQQARKAGAAGADLLVRQAAEARSEALALYRHTEAAARRSEAALYRAQTLHQQTRAEVAAAQEQFGEILAAAPILPPIPPGSSPVIPGAQIKDPVILADSIQVRELDVWGQINVSNIPTWAGGSIYISPTGVPATDTANIQFVLNAGQVARLTPGTNFAIGTVGSSATGLTVPAGGSIVGPAPGLCQINYVGNGIGISSHGTAPGGAPLEGNGCQLLDFTLDGTACGAAATVTGIDVGDQYGILLWRVTVQNFTSTGTTAFTGSNPLGAVGININNFNTLTEKLFVWSVCINNCGTPNLGPGTAPNTGGGAAFQLVTTSGSSTSHMYSEIDIQINQQPGQNGLVIARQGHLMNGRLIMRGNMNLPGSGNNGSAAIVVGVGTGGGQAGHIQRMYMDVHIESDGGAGGTTQAFTIYAGLNSDNTINRCHGRLQFLDGFQNSNLAVGTQGVFEFSGPIVGGDTVLVLTPSLGIVSSGTPVNYNGNDAALYFAASGGSVSAIVLNGNTLATFSSPLIVCAGTTITFTFTGTLNTSTARIGQGN